MSEERICPVTGFDCITCGLVCRLLDKVAPAPAELCPTSSRSPTPEAQEGGR